MKNKQFCLVGIISDQEFFLKDSVWKIDPAILNDLKLCDIVEFRGDCFHPEKMIEALKSFHQCLFEFSKLEILFTLRLKEDGGNWDIQNPRGIFFELALPWVDWVDIELEQIFLLSSLKLKIQEHKVKLIFSHHQFHRGYSLKEYGILYKKMEIHVPEMIKIVVHCQNESELDLLFEFVKYIKPNIPKILSCFISMGNFGKMSRIGTPLLGSKVTYGFLGEKSFVNGQISISQLSRNILASFEGMKRLDPSFGIVELKKIIV